MASLQGQLLVAAPELADPNFRQTVVLLVQHGSEGALGLVLNRPAPARMHEIWEKAEQGECPRDDRVFIGGPCSGPLMVLHQSELQADVVVAPDLYFTGQSEHILAIVHDPLQTARFFVGYAGWGEGQLERELEAGGWLLLSAEPDDVFGEHDDLWDRIIKRIGRDKLAAMLRLKQMPADPSVN